MQQADWSLPPWRSRSKVITSCGEGIAAVHMLYVGPKQITTSHSVTTLQIQRLKDMLEWVSNLIFTSTTTSWWSIWIYYRELAQGEEVASRNQATWRLLQPWELRNFGKAKPYCIKISCRNSCKVGIKPRTKYTTVKIHKPYPPKLAASLRLNLQIPEGIIIKLQRFIHMALGVAASFPPVTSNRYQPQVWESRDAERHSR